MNDKSKINNYLSKTSVNIINNLNTFADNNNLDIFKKYLTNKQIEKYFTLIYNLYKKISYKLDIINCQTINSNNNLCNTFELLSYLKNDKNINEYYKKSINFKKNKYSLHDIIDNKNVDACKIWINIYGKLLLRNIFQLKHMGKIPKDFFESIEIIDKDIFSEFTPIDIFDYISKNTLTKLSLKITMKNLTINLNLISKKKISKRVINNIVKRICLMYLLKHHTTNQSSNVTLTLLFSDFKKKLPKDYNVLGPREINSGVATFYENKILIYRNEEYSKLLIHELVHLFKLDFSVINMNFLRDILDINQNIQTIPNESFTEILTIIINSIIVSIEISEKKNLSLATSLINYEIVYNLFQCSKILKHFGYETAYDFFRKNDGNQKFDQTTSVISYFFIKTACLYNSKNFMYFMNNNFTELNYDNKELAMNNYTNLAKNSLQNLEFHRTLDSILESLQNNKTKKESIFFNNLRMTCIETD